MSWPIAPPLPPMLALRVGVLPADGGWLFEPKWDGFRALVFKDGDEVYIQSRDEKPLARYYPELLPALVAQLAQRAAAEGLAVDAREGDAEALPFADGSFDTVVTMFGAMFAANPQRAANELLRVTRSGGRIAMATWVPEGFIGRMLKVTVGHVPPPAGVPSVLLWGDPAVVQERLGAGATGFRFERRPMALAFPFGPEKTVELFRTWYGPTVRAFAALDDEGKRGLHTDLVRLWTEHNTAGPTATRVESEFLEVVATRA